MPIPSTYVYRGQIEEAANHLLAALEAMSDHAPTTGHAEAARLVDLARQNIANIYALAEEGATEYRVRILVEVFAPLRAPEDDSDQADTPWSTAASFLAHAADWNSRAELRLLEPSEPEGEHDFGIVRKADAEWLYCWKHLAWEKESRS